MNVTSRAIDAAGGTTAVARECAVKPQAVSQWKARGIVPARHVLTLERLCESRVTRYELRPDVYGERA